MNYSKSRVRATLNEEEKKLLSEKISLLKQKKLLIILSEKPQKPERTKLNKEKSSSITRKSD